MPPHVTSSASRADMLAKYSLPSTRGSIWLAAGRLAHAKGFSDLVDAVAILRHRQPQLLVAIAGEGPLYHELHSQILRLGLSDHVTFRSCA